jgi:hypothetical protein
LAVNAHLVSKRGASTPARWIEDLRNRDTSFSPQTQPAAVVCSDSEGVTQQSITSLSTPPAVEESSEESGPAVRRAARKTRPAVWRISGGSSPLFNDSLLHLEPQDSPLRLGQEGAFHSPSIGSLSSILEPSPRGTPPEDFLSELVAHLSADVDEPSTPPAWPAEESPPPVRKRITRLTFFFFY